jgi:type III restriction enzyme
MKLQFEKNQQHQIEAIESIVALFQEQEKVTDKTFPEQISSSDEALLFSESIRSNILTLSDETVLSNLQRVQRGNGFSNKIVSDSLERMWFNEATNVKGFIPNESIVADFANFSLEMETGTGKTYVYLRSIFELNEAYGWTKFVIVVPSIAIREGVLKSLEMTTEHFGELYGNIPCEFKVYDASRPSYLTNFARSNSIQILVINIDSFAKDDNIINQISESGTKPISFIQEANPIVIIDEPQNMETDIRKRAISLLNPLFTLRFSATHKNTYNLIYRLDPVRAYDLGLVKQIEVDSVVSRNGSSGTFVSLDDFKTNTRSVTAKISIYMNQSNGIVKKQVTAKVGDDLHKLSKGVESYQDGYIVNEIDSEASTISFSNGQTIVQGESLGGLSEEILREMVDATVENHFKKEKELAPKGIKVLSIFFVDKVSNYRSYDATGNPVQGKFAKWFEESFKKWNQSSQFKGLFTLDAFEVHDGYFSQDKGKVKDSKEGRLTKTDDETFTLIMKDKERLLDPATPLRFIFSHSALREGWDNPNVFQICTLNETKSVLRKRQELGRGLRLCVNTDGVRVMDRNLNRLTVIANEEYEDFSRSLQKEIEEDCGVNFEGRIKDARKRAQIKLKNKWMDDSLFLELWDKIKHRTIYSVDYASENLIKSCISAINDLPPMDKVSIHREKNVAKFIRNEKGELVELSGIQTSSRERALTDIAYSIPDLVSHIQSKTEITRHSITQILLGTSRLRDVFVNPQQFMDAVVRIIKYEFDQIKLSGIKYEKIGASPYEMRLFEIAEVEQYLDNLVKVQKADKTLYNYVVVDSNSRPERDFAEACEARDDILFYVKLPKSFQIPTPIGAYIPDWALIKQDEDKGIKIYFVAETKDSKHAQNLHLLRLQEQQKIKCATKHFEAVGDVSYQVVGSVDELKVSF